MIDNDEIIELIDEDGKEVKFGFEDSLEIDGKEYVVLLPLDEEENVDEEFETVVILRVDKNEKGEECLVTIETEEEENMVFEEFFRRREEEFDVEE